MSVRSVLPGLAALLMIAVLAACGGSSKHSTSSAAKSSSSSSTAQTSAATSTSSAATTSSSSGSAAITAAPAFTPAQQAALPAANWLVVHGNLAEQNYSSLKQIGTNNAKQLGLGWMTNLDGSCEKDASCAGEGNPLVYDGTMYVPTGADDVFAVNGATGQHLWEYKPKFVKGFDGVGGVSRGIAMGDGKLFMGRIDAVAVGIDMKTGKQLWQNKLGNPNAGFEVTGAPVYYRGLVIIPVSGGDSGSSDFLTALNAKTGKTVWKWNVVPRPGQPGYKTWGNKQAYKHGGGAIWDAVSIDPSLNMLYVGTGNQVPWNTRPPGKELYADSIVALNPMTGKKDWYFQTVHHDIWDDDIPASPVLFTGKFRPFKVQAAGHLVENASLGGNGSSVQGQKITYTGPAQSQPAMAVASKMGWDFILNRKTGKPLIPTPEVKVPTGGPGTAGLNLWPTQPIPAASSTVATCVLPSQWKQKGPDGEPVEHGCVYTPVGFKQFVAIPHDQNEWAPSSYDPTTNELYTCSINNRAWAMEALSPTAQKATLKVGGGYTGIGETQGLRQGYTGNFTAMSLASDKISWQNHSKAFCYSGATATDGGVVFSGQNDGSINAYQAQSGETLWSSTPPSSSPAANAPVITYEANGKQYISVLAAGDAHEQTPRGDIIYTYTVGGHAQYHDVKKFSPTQKASSKAAPGGIPTAASKFVDQKTASSHVINVAGWEYAFKLGSSTIPAGKDTFVFKNVGTTVHNFAIVNSKAGKYIDSGKTSSLTVTLKPGKYTYECLVPYHASYGMEGHFTVK
jgi:quinohemoprotein ethanol dehydrogenase